MEMYQVDVMALFGALKEQENNFYSGKQVSDVKLSDYATKIGGDE